MAGAPKARTLIRELRGRTIETVTGRTNVVLGEGGENVLVGTERTPGGGGGGVLRCHSRCCKRALTCSIERVQSMSMSTRLATEVRSWAPCY